MLERTLNTQLAVKDALKPYFWNVELYPISSEIISYVRSTELTYEKYLKSLAAKKAEEPKEEERKWREEVERRALKESLGKEKESIVA